jgi:hypothetical protein
MWAYLLSRKSIPGLPVEDKPRVSQPPHQQRKEVERITSFCYPEVGCSMRL